MKNGNRPNTSSDVSRPDLKIRISGDRLRRADLRRKDSGILNFSQTMVLPADPARQCPHHWLIVIEGVQGASKSIRVEVAGDVIMGVWRGDSSPQPDLDFGLYSSEEKGVSRHHAVLRPSRNRLYLIDLGSRNGTFINNMPVSEVAANEVQDGDIISLSVLSFTVKILQKPE